MAKNTLPLLRMPRRTLLRKLNAYVVPSENLVLIEILDVFRNGVRSLREPIKPLYTSSTDFIVWISAISGSQLMVIQRQVKRARLTNAERSL